MLGFLSPQRPLIRSQAPGMTRQAQNSGQLKSVRFQFKGKYMTTRAPTCTARTLYSRSAGAPRRPVQTLACNTGSSWSTATEAAVARARTKEAAASRGGRVRRAKGRERECPRQGATPCPAAGPADLLSTRLARLECRAQRGHATMSALPGSSKTATVVGFARELSP